MLAAIKGHKECLINLLNRSANLELRSNSGYTALISAAKFSQYECVGILLENGANINAVTNTQVKNQLGGNMTALHYAAFKNDWETVQILLRSNANTTLRDTNNHTAQDYAKMDVKKYFDTSTKAYRDMKQGK